MKADLARVVVGLPLAATWPLTLPSIAASRLKAALLATVSALYVTAPLLPEARGVVLVLLAAALACALAPSARDTEDPFAHPLPLRPLLGVLVLATVAAAVVDADQARRAIETFVEDDAAALTLFGLIGCVFLGGALVSWILSPFTDALSEKGRSRPR